MTALEEPLAMSEQCTDQEEMPDRRREEPSPVAPVRTPTPCERESGRMEV
jgi:hypothetical protein